MSFITSWRTAVRVARRETRRAKGRSALVILMIAVPILALTVAAATYDMFQLRPAEYADRIMGSADARIEWPSRLPITQTPDPNAGWYSQSARSRVDEDDMQPGTTEELLAALPGASAIPLHRGAVAVRTKDGVAQPNAIAVDATNPLTEGYVEVLAGRAPWAENEVALTEQAAARIGQGLGGTVVSADGKRSYTVVGLVEFPSLLREVLLFPGGDADTPENFVASNNPAWLVRTPEPVTWEQVQQLNQAGMVVASRAVLLDPPPVEYDEIQAGREEVGLGVLVGGLALLEIVLLAGPAFAVSARRRQRQLALVAATGGTPAHVRRIVFADGVVLGAFGAVIGIGLGIVAAFAGRPLIEEYLYFERAGGYRVFPLALAIIALLAVVTGLLAALVPAFVTARQDVVAALAGRRGVTRSRKRWIALGLAMTAFGSLIVIVGVMSLSTTVMLGGIIIGELGLVLCTPALVGLVARIGRALPLAPRIALRDAARNRASAAPAISAVMAAVAGSVAIGLYFDSDRAQQIAMYQPQLPVGYAQVWLHESDDPDNPAPSVGQAEVAMRAALEVSDVRPLGQVRCAPDFGEEGYCVLQPVMVPEYECPYERAAMQRQLTVEEQRQARADERCSHTMLYLPDSVVDDGTALAVYTGATGEDLAAATATLRSGGVVVRDPRYIKDGKATFAVVRYGSKSDADPYENAPRVTFDAHLLTTGVKGAAIVSPSAVEQAGFAVRAESSLVAATLRMPTQAEQDRFYGELERLVLGGSIETGPRFQFDGILFVLMAVSALITIGAAAIGTGLAAADGRADLSTLAAVGASPRIRRGLSLSQSGVIAGLGSLLGALAGMGAAVAVIMALNQRFTDVWPAPVPHPVAIPWEVLAVALLVVPAVAIFGAGLFTRSRLPIERRT